MEVSRITYLFYRHFDGNATPEERLELAAILRQRENEAEIKLLMEEAWQSFTSPSDTFPGEISDRMLRNIIASEKEDDPKAETFVITKDRFPWKRIAASVGIILSIGTGLLYKNGDFFGGGGAKVVNELKPAKDIAPGGSKALLTLSDGSTIVLDQASEGQLARQGNTLVIKTGEGELAYQVSARGRQEHSGYNTLKTPRGGQYSLLLPDGSKVWLNAASSIRYPTVFDDHVRVTEIRGEAYFEIKPVYRPGKPTEKIPFRVKVNDVEVEVLGTHFNINAYGDEGVTRTTLLEGAVRVHKGAVESLLKPGQQASVSGKSSGIKVTQVNVGQAIAWKNGYFQFHKATLDEIMRQLTKWYDVEARYEGSLPAREFTGEIPRSATLLEVLQILEVSNVRLNVEGKEIVVKP
jgi:transmembrane sensor